MPECDQTHPCNGPIGQPCHGKAEATVMARHDIVVIGASAGGVDALQTLVHGFPEDLPASVFIVLHMGAHRPSVLPALLNLAGPLIAAHASHGEPITHRRMSVAPPDAHLLVVPGQMQLGDGPKEHYTRPAVDPLFRSAAGALWTTGGGPDPLRQSDGRYRWAHGNQTQRGPRRRAGPK
jgi:chemotaxis response regulator CheB